MGLIIMLKAQSLHYSSIFSSSVAMGGSG